MDTTLLKSLSKTQRQVLCYRHSIAMVISTALLTLVLTLAIAFISKLIFKRGPKKNRPPGPKPWPVIGNLNKIGPTPHQSLHILSQKYGALMQLKFGKFPVVVASSPEMAEQFLKVHDAVFASRPLLAAGKYTSYNYSDIVWAPYGPHWKQSRRILHAEVFSSRKLELFEHICVEETRCFMSRVNSMSGKPIMLRHHLIRHMLLMISRIAIGEISFNKSEIQEESAITNLDELQEMLDEWFVLGGAINIGDWIPWLSFLDLQGYVKRMKAMQKKLDNFFNRVIDDHLSKSRSKDVNRDVADALLKLADDASLEVELTKDSMKGLLQNLLTGGTDTSATTVEWAIQEMLRQPRIIENAKEELDRVVGRNRWVEERDLSGSLPYIDAILMESMRLHPLATFLGPHYAIEDCNVSGYDISKGTTILINTWSLGRDPYSWDEPEKFLPERFMGREIDMLGGNFALLPFGSGRRRCPGYKLGLVTARSALANLLHGFDMKLPQGMKAEDISIDEEYGLTTHPKVALSILMEPTLPSHLYY